jgi:hypothetical protein
MRLTRRASSYSRFAPIRSRNRTKQDESSPRNHEKQGLGGRQPSKALRAPGFYFFPQRRSNPFVAI